MFEVSFGGKLFECGWYGVELMLFGECFLFDV